ncbi:MAG: M20/M25/M40 family metallo-hydrolase [Saprospiraceae bacterium]
MKQDIQKVQQYFREKSTDMKAFLKRLAEVESPSSDVAAQAPVFAILENKFAEIGFTTNHFPGQQSGGYLIAKPEQRPKNAHLQMMIGHCDTVWSKGTLANMPLEETNGMLKGPGVFDMKAGLVQMLFALQAIRDLGLTLKVTPVCLINSDEEIGSFWGQYRCHPPIVKIADFPVYVLEPPLGLEGKLKTARKGLGRFTLKVKGIAAHAGLNPGDGAAPSLNCRTKSNIYLLSTTPKKE